MKLQIQYNNKVSIDYKFTTLKSYISFVVPIFRLTNSRATEESKTTTIRNKVKVI